MAKPKYKFIVKEFPYGCAVYCDNYKQAAIEILRIEGVREVLTLVIGEISVLVDPRYNVGEVAQEIRELLESEVPDVFREDM